MKLYTAKLAPNPRRVTMFIAEKGLSDKIEQVELQLGTEAKSKDHRKRSREGLVPVLELADGRYLSESRAICTYLEGVEPEPNLMGEGPDERAFVEMYDRRMELMVLMPVANWVRHGHPGLAGLEKTQLADWASMNQIRAEKAFKRLDDHLAETPFVAGNRFTIADITAFCAMDFARLMKFKAWENLPNLSAWRDKMLTRPSTQF